MLQHCQEGNEVDPSSIDHLGGGLLLKRKMVYLMLDWVLAERSPFVHFEKLGDVRGTC
jgi:hypothetical protein